MAHRVTTNFTNFQKRRDKLVYRLRAIAPKQTNMKNMSVRSGAERLRLSARSDLSTRLIISNDRLCSADFWCSRGRVVVQVHIVIRWIECATVTHVV